jgi:S-adenosylmethionine-diacylglycerol 3-amino-3-carboxypropyl transferase
MGVNMSGIQFSVVREDPMIEQLIVERFAVGKCLLVASGGCTALSLSAMCPNIDIDVFDLNSDQIELLSEKSKALQGGISNSTFDIGKSNSLGLNQSGSFEKLFRGLRKFIWDFVAPAEFWEECFNKEGKNLEDVFSNKFWKIGFELFFHDSLLNGIFGPDATQYAQPGSYPDYFRNVIENGLKSTDRGSNYFLHHILIGYYKDEKDSLPPYLQGSFSGFKGKKFIGTLDNISNLKDYQLIQLSNLFDWMSPEDSKKIWDDLGSRMAPGAIVLVRQLNNKRDLSIYSGQKFKYDEKLGNELLDKDRSMFYERIFVATKL